MTEPLSSDTHEVAATDFERGIQYGNMLSRLSDQESRHATFASKVDADLAELRSRIEAQGAIAEVALDIAQDAAQTANDAEDTAEVAEVIAVVAAEVATDAAEDVEDATDDTPPVVDAVTLVPDTEPAAAATAAPEVTEPPVKRKRSNAFGKRS